MATDIILEQEEIEVLARILRMAEGKLRIGTSGSNSVEVQPDRMVIKASEDNSAVITSHAIVFSNSEGRAKFGADRLSLTGSLGAERINGDYIFASDEVMAPNGVMLKLVLGAEVMREIPAPGHFIINDEEGKKSLEIRGEDGSLAFANGEDPLIYIFESGTRNPDRLLLAHSPEHSDWGLLYRDLGDKMIFQSGDGSNESVLSVDLGNRKVGIGTDEPDESVKLDVKGKMKASRVDTPSDARLKKKVSTIADAGQKISCLRGIGFQWRKDVCEEMGVDSGRHWGLMAQETEDILPEVVSEDAKGFYSIAYNEVVPVLVEAVKEQQQTIDDLRVENEKLQQTVDSTQGRVDRLESVEERLVRVEQLLEQPVA